MLSTYPPHPVPPPFPFPFPETAPRAPLVPPLVYVAPLWEYKQLKREIGGESPIGEQELNALGAEGWELAATIPTATTVHFYFKRARE